MNIQINRKDFIELNNISKIVERRGKLLVYKRKGYPHAVIASCGIIEFKMRIFNARGSLKGIQIIREY